MKVTMNKYLKTLNLEENNFPFSGEENEEGFVEEEFYSLDLTLAISIYSYLCYFREHCLISYPSTVDNYEKWKTIIDKMIKAFELIIRSQTEDDFKYSKNIKKKINFGKRLFIKYFNDLWW